MSPLSLGVEHETVSCFGSRNLLDEWQESNPRDLEEEHDLPLNTYTHLLNISAQQKLRNF